MSTKERPHEADTQPELHRRTVGRPADGARAPITNPATGTVLGEVAASSRVDVDHAVEAAETGWQTWRETTPRERSEYLFALADAMAAHRSELADLESANVASPS